MNHKFWQDTRFLKIVFQIFVLLIVGGLFAFFAYNFSQNFRLGFNLGVLFDPQRQASFDIGDTLIPFTATDPLYKAILVGLLNSLRVMVMGIILATLLGTLIGLGRISDNWLVKKICLVYVDIFRNTPLLLQLFFWYTAVFLKFPPIENYLRFWYVIIVSNRGISFPFPRLSLQTIVMSIFLFIGLIIYQFLPRRKFIFMVTIIIIFLIGLDWQVPRISVDNQLEDGIFISPEFASILVGLTLYTAAFIAEVVRAGIQSVNLGQWEAAKSLGLKPNLVMRLVIFPQALRVIIPPLTSEFLNLAKNSSLASATLYKDIYAVSYTIFEKTGRALEMMLVVMLTYLIINLIISLGMNIFNRWVIRREGEK
jgi:general L-amino acid transport system permease protein